MNLGRSIAYLLKHYPAVYVPGIGVFTKQFISATDERDTNTLHPPSSTISLVTGSVSGFDVTNFIQAQEAMDASGALALLSTEVAELFARMRKIDYAELDSLGRLYLEGDTLKFEQRQISELELPPVDNIFPTEDSIAQQQPEEIAIAPVLDVAVDVPQMESEGEAISGKRSKVWWWVAAVVLLLTSFTIALWIFNPQQAKQWYTHLQTYMPGMAAPGEPSALVPVLDAESELELVQEDPTLDSIWLDSLAMDAVPTDSVAVVPVAAVEQRRAPTVTYEIIVGSFVTMEQAEKYVAEMKAKGYDLKAMDSKMPGNRKKISWGSFSTKEAADRELAKVKREFEPGAWIAKVEN